MTRKGFIENVIPTSGPEDAGIQADPAVLLRMHFQRDRCVLTKCALQHCFVSLGLSLRKPKVQIMAGPDDRGFAVRRPYKVYLLPQRAALPSLQTLAARSRCRIVSLLVCLVAGHDVTSRHAHIRLSASRVHRDDLRPLKRTLELMPLGIACPVFPTKFHDASACADSDRGHQQKQLR